jgi:hypothetical protein
MVLDSCLVISPLANCWWLCRFREKEAGIKVGGVLYFTPLENIRRGMALF